MSLKRCIVSLVSYLTEGKSVPQDEIGERPDASRFGGGGEGEEGKGEEDKGEEGERDKDTWDESAPVVEVPIDGTLDLHTYRPKDVGDLVPEYLSACQERGIFQVRVVHGKGRGMLRRSVHALLDRSPLVESYHLAEPYAGGWGATLVILIRTSDRKSPERFKG